MKRAALITGITGQDGSYLAEVAKARTVLGWQPTHSFSELVSEMIDCDLQALQS